MARSGGIKAGEAFVEVYGDDSRLVRTWRGIQARAQKLGQGISSVGQRVAGIGAGISALGGVGAAALSWPLKLAANMEMTEASFTTLLKDQEKAKTLLGELQQFAASTPFQFDELADASKKLLAFGSEAQNVQGELRRIGDISSAIGAPIGEIAEIYGKARVQGRLFAEDINQLTGRGIPIIQELAKQFGVTDQEVRKLVQDGKVNFGNLEQAFKDLTTGAGQFAGGMARQSKTLAGSFSTLKDNIVAAFRPFGQELLPAAKAALKIGTELVKTFAKWAENNKGLVLPIAAASAAVVALGGAATTAGIAIIGLGAAVSAVGTIAGGVSAVVGAVSAPVLAIVAGVTAGVLALGGGFVYVAQQAGLIAPALNYIKRSFGEIFGTFKKTFGGIVGALQSGQIGLAAQIAWSGFKVAALQGTQAVLRGVEYLWDNAGQITTKFLFGLGDVVYRVFSNLPKIALSALRGGAAFQQALQSTLAGAFNSDVSLADQLDPAIAKAQAELDAKLALVQQQTQPSAPQPPAELSARAAQASGAVGQLNQQTARATAAQVTSQVVDNSALGPLAELLAVARQQLNVQTQLANEGLE